MTNNSDRLMEWSRDCSQAVDDFLDLMAPFLLDRPQVEPKLQWILKHLAISCNQTTESAILLISYVRLWDAEVLIRSVVEGTLKFAFLCTGTLEERLGKVEEYWESLFEITQIKDHQRVTEFLSKVDDPNAIQWQPLRDLQMSSDEAEVLRTKHPRDQRRRLDQKWSFSEIIQSLSRSDVPGFELFSSLAYNYGVGSHLVHQDSTAIRIIWDRNQREEERRLPLELAHGARELSDLLVIAMFRSLVTYKLHGVDTEPVKHLDQAQQGLRDKLTEAYKAWHSVEYKSME